MITNDTTITENIVTEFNWYFDLFENPKGFESPIAEVSMALCGIKWDDTGMLTGANDATDGFEEVIESAQDTLQKLQAGEYPNSHEHHVERCINLLELGEESASNIQSFRVPRDTGLHPYSEGLTARTFDLPNTEGDSAEYAICHVKFTIPMFGSAGIHWEEWDVTYTDDPERTIDSLISESHEQVR